MRQFLDLQQDQAPSQLQLFTKGILVDSIVPAAGSMTCRSATGKVNLITDNTKKWHCLLCLACITGASKSGLQHCFDSHSQITASVRSEELDQGGERSNSSLHTRGCYHHSSRANLGKLTFPSLGISLGL